MKNLITSVACVLLLMAFTVQFAHNQSMYFKFVEVQNAVEEYEENIFGKHHSHKAEEENLKEQLSYILDCAKKKIHVNDNSIKIEVDDIIALPDFWGIENEVNQMEYTIPLNSKREKEE